MTYLKKKKSLQCEVGVSKLDLSEIHKYKKKVVDWDVKSNEKKNLLLRKKL